MSHKLKTLSRAVLAMIGTALITPAYAAVLFTVERIDDTHARLTGSGTLSAIAPSANGHALALKSPFAINPTDDEYFSDALVSSTLKIGGQAVDFAYADSGAFDLFGDATTGGLHFGNTSYTSFNVGDLVSGYIDLQLTGGATFAAAGASGLVQWGMFDFANPQEVGEWIIVNPSSDVPEPGNLALGGIALAGLMMARRRRARS